MSESREFYLVFQVKFIKRGSEELYTLVEAAPALLVTPSSYDWNTVVFEGI